MRNNLNLDIMTSSCVVARRLRSNLWVLLNRKKRAVELVLYRYQTVVESTLKYSDLRDLIYFCGVCGER